METSSSACVSGIYAITNTHNGKQYIGSAVNLTNRWATHRRHLCKGVHHSPPLQAAWRKYGAEAFVFSVLEYVADVTLLIEREQHYMDMRFAAVGNIGYNARPKAENMLGYRRSTESRRMMSERYKGRQILWHDKMRGVKKSEEHRRKLSETAKARHMPEEQRARISAKLKGRPKKAQLTELSRETRRRNVLATRTPEALAKAAATRRSHPPTPKQLAYWHHRRHSKASTAYHQPPLL